MNTNVFLDKKKRIHEGAPPRVLDLFAGCGGISLGFESAGFDIVGAIEIDEFAAQTHALNFFNGSKLHSAPIDITKTDPEDFARMQGWDSVENSVDVIVGGPPCQAFARVGRAKLREVAAHPEAYIHDPRGNLYLRYLTYVKAFKPIALLMENVPDMMNYGGHNIAQEVADTLEDIGYICQYTLLNAVHYGVPEMRERMFLVAFAKEISVEQYFPKPTHYHTLPKGYEGSRQVALKTILDKNQNISEQSSFVAPPQPSSNLAPAITAENALGDLPVITDHLIGKMKRGARNLKSETTYTTPQKSIHEYGQLMRSWPNYSTSGAVTAHVIRFQPRDFSIFNKMLPGDQYPEAYKIAVSLFHERLAQLRAAGYCIAENTTEYTELFDSIVPPYDPLKFPNKWRKMEPDQPARTLMAHLGKDGYSHIHYDSQQQRTISVREAARLQSFPDGFLFSCSMNPAFKQIGNAVPPLLSKAIATNMLKQLKEG